MTTETTECANHDESGLRCAARLHMGADGTWVDDTDGDGCWVEVAGIQPTHLPVEEPS